MSWVVSCSSSKNNLCLLHRVIHTVNDFGLDTFCETFASVPPASVVPSEVDCQQYVEKAIKELVTSEPIGS